MKKFLFLLLSAFFISNTLFATTNDKHIFYLDNPTDKNIKIEEQIEEIFPLAQKSTKIGLIKAEKL